MAKATQEKIDKTLIFIKQFVAQHGYPPTVREICAELKVNSSATAQYYLNKLEEIGKIRRSSTKNRAIEIVGMQPDISLSASIPSSKTILAPLVGKVTAGNPILATENIEESLPLPISIFGKSEDLFVLTVSGESMINAGILDGDKIIVKKQNTANNGDIVVALIDDSATVKRYYKEENHVRLQPENDFMEPIIVTENLSILGLVVGLLRKM